MSYRRKIVIGTGQENVLELTVGNGWYKGILSFDCKPERYGDRTAVWAELHVRYTDGTEEVITTDETWHVRTGQIRYSEIYMGETIDTNAPDIREGKVSAVPEAVFHSTVLTPQLNEPVRVTEHLKAKRVSGEKKARKSLSAMRRLWIRTVYFTRTLCGRQNPRTPIS